MSERKYGEDKSYPIYVWNGILEPKHRKKIGPALWEFIWCIDRITKEKDGVGIVLGGMPMTFAEIAAELGSTERTVRRNIDRLYFGRYIELIRTPRGHQIRVLNSCKFTKRPTKSVIAEVTTGKNGQSDRPKVASHSDKSGQSDGENGRSNIRVSSMSNQYEEAVEKTPASAVSLSNLSRLKSLPRSMSQAEVDERRRLLLKQSEELSHKYSAKGNGLGLAVNA